MKFTPKEIEGNVNVSPTHPLAELAWLVGGIVFLLALFWLVLGLATELAVAKIPLAAERWLGERALAAFPEEPDLALDARLQALLQTLPADSPLRGYRFTAHRFASNEVNAVALPGGHIVVFSGLLQKVESENELAMVLAHELGHFAHRDHLKGLGRGLGIAVAAMFLLGPDNSASQLASNLFLPLQATYSQRQEAAADAFAVDLLAARFGHVGGATAFFERLAASAGAPAAYLLASHPHPGERIAGIRARIAQQGLAERETQSLEADLGMAPAPGKND